MKKYIEKDFPIGFLSQLAERESWRKEIYRPVYYIHKWWAKRLGSVFRGIVLATCSDESADILKSYYSKNCFSDLTVFDPFMGSGVTVGEAAKLGCRVIGRDINPMSSVIVRASLAKYKVDEINSIFIQIENNIKDKIQSLYKTKLDNGKLTDVLYYFWVKILNCPNCENETDLFKSRIFSKNAVPKKDPSARAVCPGCHGINHTFYDCEKTTCSICKTSYNPQNGNINGGTVSCPHCSYKFKLVEYLKKTDQPLNHKLYAKLVLDEGVKVYEKPNAYDFKVLDQVKSEFELLSSSKKIPFVSIKKGYNTNQILKYNYKSWDQMFSPRQLICIHLLCDEIKQLSDSHSKQLFSCLLSGILEFNNMFCTFKGEGTGAVRHIFAHHILKTEVMPIEANIWGTPKSSGSFSTLYKSRILRSLDYKSNPFELQLKNRKSLKISNINIPLNCDIAGNYSDFRKNGPSVYISHGDSGNTDIENLSVDMVITDPPFFDNVHYSQLADFFYYWLNQILNISDDETTRHEAEVQDTDADKFSEKLCSVFSECNRVLKNEGLLIFTYHHSRHEGWTAVYEAIRKAGFICVQSYPVKAEMSVSVSVQQAKTPIHLDLILVCRKSGNEKAEFDAGNILRTSVEKAKTQITELTRSEIKVSPGDSKVALMGRILCELGKMADMEKEINFLRNVEEEVNPLLSDLIVSQEQKIAYPCDTYPDQLQLFE